MLVIGGPTASGKSELALALAERLGGTIINADSMQVYSDLEILTARPGPGALARAPHALYGVLDGEELCSAARWAEMAGAAADQAEAAPRVPILCGGSGLYLRTLLAGIAHVPEIRTEVRSQARALHAALGGRAFKAELSRLDPQAAARLHESDAQRLIRAYEVVVSTGRALGEWQRAPLAGPPRAHRTILLMPPREELHRRIDARVLRMVEEGALSEVRHLLERRLDPTLPVMKAIGVPEFAAHLSGELSLDEAVTRAQQATRQYAKRQFTWFRHQMRDAVVLPGQYSARFLDQFCQNVSKSA